MKKKQILLLIYLIFFYFNAYAQKTENDNFYKYYKKSFSSNKIKNINLIAKYADINIYNWDKDSISVETEMKIHTNLTSLAKEIFNNIKINVVTYSNTLQVKMTSDENFRNNILYDVKYNIFIPYSINAKIKNNNGSLNIPKIQGDINVNLSFCSFNMQNIINNKSDKNVIKLNYCNGNINKITNSYISLNSSTLNVLNAEKINCNSEYSNINIQKINSLKINSKLDIINISKINNLMCNSIDGKIFIKNLNNSCFIKNTKGEVNINKIEQTFTNLLLDLEETEANIRISKNSSYIINANFNNAELIYKDIPEIKKISDYNSNTYKGTVGLSDNYSSITILNKQKNVKLTVY